MPATNQMLRLPPERIEQLKALTSALGLASTAETVGHLIRGQIESGVIPAAIPGFVVSGELDHVGVGVDGATQVSYSRATANKIAEVMRSVADGKAAGTADITGNFIVMRQGNGVRMQFPLTGPVKVVSPDVARDVAGLLEQA